MPMNAAKLLLLNVLGGSAADTSASFTATTTGAQKLTIMELTVSAATTVDWGDGSSNVYTGSGTRTHNYAGAGTWTVRILEPLNVTVFQIIGGPYQVGYPSAVQLALDTRCLRGMTNLLTLAITYLEVMTINSTDIAAMTLLNRLTIGDELLSGPYTGTIDLADLRALPLTNLSLFRIGAGKTGVVYDPVAVAGWGGTMQSLAIWETAIQNTNALAAADFSALTGVTNFRMDGNALTQAQVDAVLLGLYTAAQSRTVTGGTMNLSSSNAAPSGTYAAECPPTTGKSAAYELINDSCGTIAAGETWTTITVTGGLP